jgi:hypothetical protein
MAYLQVEQRVSLATKSEFPKVIFLGLFTMLKRFGDPKRKFTVHFALVVHEALRELDAGKTVSNPFTFDKPYSYGNVYHRELMSWWGSGWLRGCTRW